MFEVFLYLAEMKYTRINSKITKNVNEFLECLHLYSIQELNAYKEKNPTS